MFGFLKVITLISAFCSLSIRTPVTETNPLDYEFKCGLKTSHFYNQMLWEREEGGYYRGYDIQIWPHDAVELRYFCKEAQEIDFAKIYAKKYLSDALVVGGGLFANFINDVADPQAFARYSSGGIAGELAVGPNSYTAELRLGRKIKITRLTYYEPKIVYKDINGSHFFQFKVSLGLNFK